MEHAEGHDKRGQQQDVLLQLLILDVPRGQTPPVMCQETLLLHV